MTDNNFVANNFNLGIDLDIDLSAPVQDEHVAKKVHFPSDYILEEGNYQCGITSYCIENTQNGPSLLLELIPLQKWEMGRKGRTIIELEHKCLIPLRYQFKFDEGYSLPRPDGSGDLVLTKRNKLVKAIMGDYSLDSYIKMWNNNIIGKQIDITIVKKGTAERMYISTPKDGDIFAFVPVDEYLPYPDWYSPEMANSTIIQGQSEEGNWLEIIPVENWSEIAQLALLPPSDYIYLQPPKTVDVQNWFNELRIEKSLQFEIVLEKIFVFYIKKVNKPDNTKNYPDNLEGIQEWLKGYGLKKIDKKELLNGIKFLKGKTKNEVWNWSDNWFKTNCPELFAKKVRKPTIQKLEAIN